MTNPYTVTDFTSNRDFSVPTYAKACELAVLVARRSGHSLIRHARTGRLIADYLLHNIDPVAHVSVVQVGPA